MAYWMGNKVTFTGHYEAFRYTGAEGRERELTDGALVPHQLGLEFDAVSRVGFQVGYQPCQIISPSN